MCAQAVQHVRHGAHELHSHLLAVLEEAVEEGRQLSAEQASLGEAEAAGLRAPDGGSCALPQPCRCTWNRLGPSLPGPSPAPILAWAPAHPGCLAGAVSPTLVGSHPGSAHRALCSSSGLPSRSCVGMDGAFPL